MRGHGHWPYSASAASSMSTMRTGRSSAGHPGLDALVAVEGKVAQTNQRHRDRPRAGSARSSARARRRSPERAAHCRGRTTKSCASGRCPPRKRHFTEGRRASQIADLVRARCSPAHPRSLLGIYSGSARPAVLHHGRHGEGAGRRLRAVPAHAVSQRRRPDADRDHRLARRRSFDRAQQAAMAAGRAHPRRTRQHGRLLLRLPAHAAGRRLRHLLRGTPLHGRAVGADAGRTGRLAALDRRRRSVSSA